MAALLRETEQLLDRLGLYTTEVYQRSREQVIIRQQQELMELSTPVVTLWEGVLALPVIGTLDSARTQVVMENLLQRIVETGASIAIIDITGVPTVDTLTAQHLLKTVAAARLMGADCIISGIRPQIAQTIVHLGVDLGTVVTKATLADAFAVALRRLGLAVVKPHAAGKRSRDSDDTDAPQLAERERELTVERIPILKMGEYLLVTIQVDMHDRLAMTLQDDLTVEDRQRQRQGRAHRHLGARDGRLVHRPHARRHRRHVARARCRNRGRRHAAGGRDHAGGARPLAARRPHRTERRARHGAAASPNQGAARG